MNFEIGEVVGIDCICSPKKSSCRSMGTVQSVLVPPPVTKHPKDAFYRALYPRGHYVNTIPDPPPPYINPQWIPLDWLRKLPPLAEKRTAREAAEA